MATAGGGAALSMRAVTAADQADRHR